MVAFAVIALLSSAAPSSTVPQTDEPEEIVVTGERVERSVKRTSSSVDVFTADRLEAEAGTDRIDQLLEQSPNVQLGNGSDGPTIRGQDTTGVLRDLPGFLGGSRPRTTLQVDGRAVSFNEFVFGASPLWDIEQVEIFRTPQTTTQGRNSIAGAIFVRSKDPTYEWEGRARILAGNYDLRQLSALVSGPIVKDRLAFRIAGDIRRGRPFSKIVDVTRGADPNNDDYSLLRVKLLAEPAFWPSGKVQLTYSHTESLSPQSVGIRPPYKKRRDPIDRYGTFGTNVDSLTAVASYALTGQLKGTTTLSLGSAHARRFALAGFGEARNRVRDRSIESILDWNPSGSTRLVGGVSYLTSRLDQFIDLSLVFGLGEFDDRQSSFGLFGEASFEPLPRTTLTAGLRYQQDRQKRVGVAGRPGLSAALDYNETFSALLPKLSLAYAITDDVTLGGLVQRAYNPGGTTLRFDTPVPETFDAERLWNYELFVRSSPVPGVQLSANIFYTDITDSQRARSVPFRIPGGPTAFFAEISNVPKAWTRGAEVTLDWRLDRRLSARAAIGLLDTRIVRTDDPDDPASGKKFQRSPAFTASASLDWKPVDAVRLSAQLRHNSRYYSDDFETIETRIGNATIADVKASWAIRRFSLFGYIRNVFDAFELRTKGIGSGFATAVDPRQFGIGLEASF